MYMNKMMHLTASTSISYNNVASCCQIQQQVTILALHMPYVLSCKKGMYFDLRSRTV